MRRNRTIFQPTYGCKAIWYYWSTTIQSNALFWAFSRRLCVMRGRAKRSSMPSCAKTTAVRILSSVGICPLYFDHSFFCTKCGNLGTSKTCSHDKPHHVRLSGTKVRAMLREGICPSAEFTRPEVAKVLIEGMSPQLVSSSNRRIKHKNNRSLYL